MEFIYRSTIRATPERVWEALTEPAFLRRFWAGCEVEVGHEAGAPFSIRYKGEPTDAGEVLVYDPPRTLSYTFGNLEYGEPPSRVTFTLEPNGETVDLTLVHDRFEPRSRLIEGVSGGWPFILSGMKSLLEGVEPDFSEVPIGNGEVHSSTRSSFRFILAAPAERVWQALTDSSMTERYFFGRRIESDFKVGSSVVYRKADGTLDVSGEILVSDPPHRLSFTWQVVGMEHPKCWVEFEILSFGPASQLTVREFYGVEMEDRALEGGRRGWPKILSGMKTLLETGVPL